MRRRCAVSLSSVTKAASNSAMCVLQSQSACFCSTRVCLAQTTMAGGKVPRRLLDLFDDMVRDQPAFRRHSITFGSCRPTWIRSSTC